MRNLVEYPITIGEICQCLDRLSDEINKEERIGDMRPLLLQEASRIILRAGFATSGVMQDKRPYRTRRKEQQRLIDA